LFLPSLILSRLFARAPVPLRIFRCGAVPARSVDDGASAPFGLTACRLKNALIEEQGIESLQRTDTKDGLSQR